MYNFEYVKGQGLKAQINKDKLAELMEQDKRDEANQEDLDYLEECKSDKDDWDMKESNYL